jgi:uncharacterized protein YukE
MGKIMMATDAARGIRDTMYNLNQQQHGVSENLTRYLNNANSAWSGEVPKLYAQQLENTKQTAAFITDIMNDYCNALKFAVEQLEHADAEAAAAAAALAAAAAAAANAASRPGGSNSGNSGGGNWDAQVGQTISSVGNNSDYYWSNGNMSYAGSIKNGVLQRYDGECTWYAYGRFWEQTGIKLKSAGDAGSWLTNNKNDTRVNVSRGADTIVPNSIAVSEKGGNGHGHVMFIENVSYDSNGKPDFVYFTECNWDSNSNYNPGKDCVLIKMSYQKFVTERTPAGYISKA